MGRRPNEAGGRPLFWILVAAVLISCALAYLGLSTALRRQESRFLGLPNDGLELEGTGAGGGDEDCCRGQEHLELWGPAVKWGADHKFNSSRDCCRACKAMCGSVGPCLCNSWVFCGDRERCGERFGECWLKKQEDVLLPALHDLGEKVIWTSGLIYGIGEGIVGLETDYGTLHIKASFGPPYALVQGTLEAEGVQFKKLPLEACSTIKRGSVAWIDSGPEFFISLANHDEWRRAYTVFGAILPEDMEIAEKIAGLQTRSDVWNNIDVLVLEKPIYLKLKRITNLGANGP
uniref:PPIase cyclophilin-type domain-containing protein n=1 Tax=Musa acuminata subsp. malaccensis TaxID=214687 RepID=A0A804J4Y6_MUSAM|nr:PREDICTED: uncharacterized protein LOC103974461 isoform X2 [Musa acuminata subsp. malaccensis]